MADEAALAAKVRDAIRAGRLPARGPTANRTFGGPGNGAICAVCGEPVTRSQMELEIEFNRHGTAPGLDRYHLHTKCFAAWEAECKTTRAD